MITECSFKKKLDLKPNCACFVWYPKNFQYFYFEKKYVFCIQNMSEKLKNGTRNLYAHSLDND